MSSETSSQGAGRESLDMPARSRWPDDGYDRCAYAEGSDADGRYDDGEQPPVRQVDDEYHRRLTEVGLNVDDTCTDAGYGITHVADAETDPLWLFHVSKPERMHDPVHLLQWWQQRTRHGQRNHWCVGEVYDPALEALPPCYRAVWRVFGERESFFPRVFHSYDGTPVVDGRTFDLWETRGWERRLILLGNSPARELKESRQIARLLRREPVMADLVGAVLWAYLTTPGVARTRYATLRGWWVVDEPPIPRNYLDDVRWEDVQAVLDGHPLAAWEERNGKAVLLSDAQVWGRKPIRRAMPAMPAPRVGRVVPIETLWTPVTNALPALLRAA